MGRLESLRRSVGLARLGSPSGDSASERFLPSVEDSEAPRNASRFHLEAMEPRVLLSADPVAVVDPALEGTATEVTVTAPVETEVVVDQQAIDEGLLVDGTWLGEGAAADGAVEELIDWDDWDDGSVLDAGDLLGDPVTLAASESESESEGSEGHRGAVLVAPRSARRRSSAPSSRPAARFRNSHRGSIQTPGCRWSIRRSARWSVLQARSATRLAPSTTTQC